MHEMLIITLSTILLSNYKKWLLEGMANIITIEVEPQQESVAPKWIMSFKEPSTVGCIHRDHSSQDTTSSTTSELDKYLNDLQNWRPIQLVVRHHKEFPTLSILARHFLSAPATSVPSEQLFSAARYLHDEKRNRLLPFLSEELLFI